ncbi:proton-conducting transporter transmembrane domain-containing protein [Spirosoma fluviale]|uniref:NADH-Ubiquinone oxidoreductase (Complex I), chain 5 N-terminus n=1 Tax=Spirosoma fluviale TaxID=1597977 RepID=A0A286GTB8_9BACT|nr:proton-conducting transporter membrane subunit [Spirosoma fluviale]SOD98783.1 NADH-Ubiquinone oxidoreductase (complex I), chain 5 N-terminus [Spirosoma fluviale]
MESFLQVFILLPVLGFVILLLFPEKKEKLISWTCFVIVGLHFALSMGFLAYWLITSRTELNLKDIVLLSSGDYEFLIDFYFDKITAVYLFVGAILTFLVTIYSRAYLHRETGYKRFFATILFFYTGYNITIFAGNFETLFIGWEILGITSFLLIAFYRNKYLPVKNAVKVFSVYRIGDVGLLLAMWMSHHLWHENITFLKLGDYALVHEHLQTHSFIGVFISLMILSSAAAKSAQLPFSSWLPRAMEGPTPSSAIFYGSLAVHLGVFLLLRTYPFWEQQTSVRILIIALGLITSVVSTGIARVQSSIKAQIAYASIAQIGLMFIEVAVGLESLALFHFAGNAFLRTYQLLVSPSVVSYLIREQFYTFYPSQRSLEDFLPKKLANTFYMLGIKEWNLDSFLYRFLWNPLKWVGNKLNFLTLNGLLIVFVPFYLVGLYSLYNREAVPQAVLNCLPVAFSFTAVIMVLKSFTERKRARVAWLLTIMNHFFVVLAISFNEKFNYSSQGLLYLSGVFVAGVVGFVCLSRLKSTEKSLNLQQFHGYSHKYPRLAFLFLLACLGVSGFPITPTFIGEDLMFTHIHENQAVLAFFTSLSFIIDGLAIIRIYARIFLGPHEKSMYEMAYRSY